MKVLYITSDPSLQSGSTRCLLSIVREMQNLTQTYVMMPNDSGALSLFHKAGIEPILQDMQSVKASISPLVLLRMVPEFARTVWQVARYLVNNDIDIVHVNEVMDAHAALAAKLTGRKLVWHVRADIGNPWLRFLVRTCITCLADAVIVPSRSVAQRLFHSVPDRKVNLRVIHDVPVDTHLFNAETDGARVAQEIGLNGAFPVVGLVSKLQRVKGHEWLINAAQTVLVHFPNARFLIVGGPVKGHETDATYIQALVDELSLDKNIILMGMREDVHSVMAACDIIVHYPAYPDPFPGVVLEAMALSKPIIGADIGGIPEQLENGKSGRLIAPQNTVLLARAITELADNETARRDLGKGALRRFSTAFSHPEQLGRLIKVYQEIL